MKITILVISIFALVATGCYYDNEEYLYPVQNTNCVTGTVSYSTDVTNILNSYGCIGCHGNQAPSGNISLTSFQGVKAVVNNGKLQGAINHASGFTPMPQGGPKMNACDIAKIMSWIDAGAPNN